MFSQLLTATKEFTWDMAHVLSGHEGLCQNLHGHTYKMEVTVARNHEDVIEDGPSRGMVLDFKNLKSIVNETLVAPLDHATMIDSTTLINTEDCEKFEVALYSLLKAFNKKVVTVQYRPTAENMARDFFNRLNTIFRDDKLGYSVVRLRLYETPTSYAEVTA